MDTTVPCVLSDVDTVHIMTSVPKRVDTVQEAATKTLNFPLVKVHVR